MARKRCSNIGSSKISVAYIVKERALYGFLKLGGSAVKKLLNSDLKIEP